jgi:hypothetical protein
MERRRLACRCAGVPRPHQHRTRYCTDPVMGGNRRPDRGPDQFYEKDNTGYLPPALLTFRIMHTCVAPSPLCSSSCS